MMLMLCICVLLDGAGAASPYRHSQWKRVEGRGCLQEEKINVSDVCIYVCVEI